MQTLRPYQREGLTRVLDAFRRGARKVLVVLPTGGGKTTVFAHLVASIKAPAVILVHRRELATQASNRLREFGVDHGLILAGERPKPYARVQIASVQTLVRRKAPPAGLVIPDEAHLSTAATWEQILEQYPDAKILGFTATPWRLSGKPLAAQYDEVVVIASPRELREQGFLSPYVGFSYKAPDLEQIEKVGDDYNQQQTGAAMRSSAIVTAIVEQWTKHAASLSTVVFACTVEHSQQLAAEFRAAGARAEHLDGSTSIEQRKAILARVKSGATQVLCNVGVAVEGLDIPRLKCCVLARPTLSLSRALQMTGRVRRPWNGVTARIHDHAFVMRQHGLPDADRDYSLTVQKAKPVSDLGSLTQCSQCFALYEGDRCPSCQAEKPVSVRTGPEMLESAEQWEFSSADEAALPEAWKPPVMLAWDTAGRAVEGIFEGTTDEQTQYGKRTRFLVKGPRRTYSLPGNAQLVAKMRAVAQGARVRVTYTGEQLFGDRTRKLFRVEVDA